MELEPVAGSIGHKLGYNLHGTAARPWGAFRNTRMPDCLTLGEKGHMTQGEHAVSSHPAEVAFDPGRCGAASPPCHVFLDF